MGEIKFSAVRMQEVLNRLAEIVEQLNNSINRSNEKLQEISNNITGSDVVDLLKKYQEYNNDTLTENKSLINQLSDYLRAQINKYTITEQEAETGMEDIQNILKGIEG